MVYKAIQKHKEKVNIAFVLWIAIASTILILIPTGFNNERPGTSWQKGVVLKTDNSGINQRGITKTGVQNLEVRIKTGEFAKDTVSAPNILLGDLSRDRIYAEGDPILITVRHSNFQIKSARTFSYERSGAMIVLLILFALFLIIFAGWTGTKALLSFLFTALSIWKILIPSFIKGHSPLLISFIVVIISTGVIILLITGFTRKGVTALLGSIIGVFVTALLALLFGELFSIPGTVQQFSEALIYTGFTGINFHEILISGIFISAAGAVMDVAMDIAASQEEIIQNSPHISGKELTLTGFRIGRSVIGTMTTTLLFAYSGTFTCTLMLFMAQGNPFITMVNTDFVAAEILHTMVGSFGLVLVAPFTALIGGFVFTRKHHCSSSQMK